MSSRPRQGALRFTLQAKVATLIEPRPRQGLSLSTSSKRSKKTFGSGSGPGATRPRLGAASLSYQRWLFWLQNTTWPPTSSLGHTTKFTK
eukprot:301753-Amphidinium_carterae.1